MGRHCRCGKKLRGHRRKCRQCQLEDRHDNSTTSTDGGHPETVVVRCTNGDCGEEYLFGGDGGCPECGARRRRFVRQPTQDDGKLRRAQT